MYGLANDVAAKIARDLGETGFAMDFFSSEPADDGDARVGDDGKKRRTSNAAGTRPFEATHFWGLVYGGRDVAHHRNIVWSNGALDPWSGQGVYPPGGGPDGPMVQNISADGSQIALILDLGAHHLDLMFSDPADPPDVTQARLFELGVIEGWIDDALSQRQRSASSGES